MILAFEESEPPPFLQLLCDQSVDHPSGNGCGGKAGSLPELDEGVHILQDGSALKNHALLVGILFSKIIWSGLARGAGRWLSTRHVTRELPRGVAYGAQQVASDRRSASTISSSSRSQPPRPRKPPASASESPNRPRESASRESDLRRDLRAEGRRTPLPSRTSPRRA